MVEQAAVEVGKVDPDVVGRTLPAVERHWTSTDALTYAVGVGAGQEDPAAEVAFTTENSQGVEQLVLPTFAITLGMTEVPRLGVDVKLAQILHADQELTLHRALPAKGHVRSKTTISDLYDKGKGALAVAHTEIRDAADGTLLATTRAGIFVRGAGGFGGERGPATDWAAPMRPPDATITHRTSPGQGLIYRLSGDRNPLHSDPAAATAVGFPRPILHGLATFGFAGRALLAAVCGGDPAQFGTMSARFSIPVFPGDELTTSIWRTDAEALFRVETANGVVLDHGRFRSA
jgi:acyl dehydratase